MEPYGVIKMPGGAGAWPAGVDLDDWPASRRSRSSRRASRPPSLIFLPRHYFFPLFLTQHVRETSRQKKLYVFSYMSVFSFFITLHNDFCKKTCVGLLRICLLIFTSEENELIGLPK